MAVLEKLTTTISTKGQVILPKPLRDQRDWKPGTRLIVEERPEGVLLRKAPEFAPTRLEDVVGMLHTPGLILTVEEMDQALDQEARHRAFD